MIMVKLVNYLGRATLVVGAIILVDDYGVVDVVHNNVLEENVPNKPVAGPGP
jgi:hypothetical protein